ncbi:MAG TPA: biopolymer transporter ExbD [Candidatus Cloacimonadota bacterium]|jgi:biopolymer transport protein ExbD|nr:biopolymer transporter ExbD [Candidatus Cloacimonadota bacterium]HOC94703.1 biopolymer transporter ExbD [Candidatus Cloacimonadota bacterium]HOF59335.1 biopolymer transporter ExbD [Candidatus Cloacimonadota bacterium]HOR58346.1 biopolymer transporter ExbD [Candidatus Cloacimonadota bacterium]HPB08708.1 biopolymer transporter ExbD [Candidatus Cloacimonadota bacterium]
MAKIQKKKREPVEIPTTSTGDISFLLLLFFMVTTVFVQERVFWVPRDQFPTAKNIDRVSRNETATIYITEKEEILIDDFPRSVEDNSIIDAMLAKSSEIPNLQVCFRSDKDTRYQIVRDVMMRLQDADTRNVVFESQKK